MLKIRPDGKCERWDELWSHSYFYDEKCDGCPHIVSIAGRKICGKIEGGRVSLHQVARSQLGCTFCSNYTKKLGSAVCVECIKAHPDHKPFQYMRTDELGLPVNQCYANLDNHAQKEKVNKR